MNEFALHPRPASTPELASEPTESIELWHRWALLILARAALKQRTETSAPLPEHLRAMLGSPRNGNGADGSVPGERPGLPDRARVEAEIAEVRAAAARQPQCALAALAKKFDLSARELEVVAFLHAHATDPALESTGGALGFTSLEGDSVDLGFLIGALFPDARGAERVAVRRIFHPTGKLLSARLVKFESFGPLSEPRLLAMNVAINHRVANQLLGDDASYVKLSSWIHAEVATPDVGDIVLPNAAVDRVLATVGAWLDQGRSGVRPEKLAFLFYGPPGTGKTLLAETISARYRLPLVRLRHLSAGGHRVGRLRLDDPEMHCTLDDLVPLVLQEARMMGGIAFFDECDDLFSRDSTASRSLLLELERQGGLAILAANDTLRLDAALDRRLTLRLPFTLPGRSERQRLWQVHLSPQGPLADDIDCGDLASRYLFAGGYVRNAVEIARLRAGPERPLRQQDVIAAAEEQRVHFRADGSAEIVAGPAALPAFSARTHAALDGVIRVARDARARGTPIQVRLRSPLPEELRATAAALAWQLEMGILFRAEEEDAGSAEHGEHEDSVSLLVNKLGQMDPLPEDCALAIEEREEVHARKPAGPLTHSVPLVTLRLDPSPRRSVLSARCDVVVELEPPDAVRRQALWRAALATEGVVITDEAIAELGARFTLRAGEIRTAARLARWQALQAGDTVTGWAHLLAGIAASRSTVGVPVLFGDR